MQKGRILAIVTTILLSACPFMAHAGGRPDKLVLERVFSMADSMCRPNGDTIKSWCYYKTGFHVRRRNFTLLTVPSMFMVAKNKRRDYVSESFSRITSCNGEIIKADAVNSLSTVPHHARAMGNLTRYLSPAVYSETIVGNTLLSPFNRINHIYYKYSVTLLMDGNARVFFRPRTNNTQLVTGSALVNASTGRIISAHILGNYDMVSFQIDVEMNTDEPGKEAYAKSCDMAARFRFMKNNIQSRFKVIYGLDTPPKDSLRGLESPELMDSLRPTPLTALEQSLYKDYYFPEKTSTPEDSIKRSNNHKVKAILWDAIGENLLNRIKSNFGENNQGYLRINPLLNPLYFGYSHRKGIVYKFDVRFNYTFSPNTEFNSRLKAGYSFKQKQFYFRLPVTFVYNRRRNGYIQVETGNGNRISTQSIRRGLEQIYPDSLFTGRDLGYFKDTYLQIAHNIDLSRYWGIKTGFVFHRRQAVDKQAFKEFGLTPVYRSSAPSAELMYRPSGWTGPIITLDYERSIKGLFRSNTSYEKWEADAQYKLSLHRLQSVQLRAGAGMYTHMKRSENYFLDYTNFREENIPGGWNDDWSGEFEMLRSEQFNYSKYYVRGNLTYESPMLLLSWIPLIGQTFEAERVYFSMLDAAAMHPYLEVGYGFTTRLLSFGIFAANIKGKFEGIECKVGLELFRHW